MARKRSSALSTASVDLAWNVRSTPCGTPCALAALAVFNWIRMMSCASLSNSTRSASGLPPTMVSAHDLPMLSSPGLGFVDRLSTGNRDEVAGYRSRKRSSTVSTRPAITPSGEGL
jgi:hypothetical protein